jgi:predicted DNA-binding transcriptional regulator AlpA
MRNEVTKYLSLEELAVQRNLKLSWLYERSRRNELPGQRRYGRLIRVKLDEFDAGVQRGVLA